MTPLAKSVFLLCIPKKNNGRLISALTLMSPPNFFCLKKKEIPSSIGASEKYNNKKIIALELAKKLAIKP